MERIPLGEFERRCQKPDHRQVGNWMARRVSRPSALRITRVAAAWRVSASVATLGAWGCGAAAAAALGWGSVRGWVLGAAMLQVWYLLDHVDGQLARWHGTASLDGAQLDYLMHHTVNLLVPLGIGWGLFARSAEPLWAAGGLVWGLSLLLITLQHDARYKAFIQRLKRVDGRLEALGGGGARPEPQPPMPRRPMRWLAWAARKACETHVIINVLALLALGQWLLRDADLSAGRLYLAVMIPIAVAVAAWTIGRSQFRGQAEAEFVAWYRLPAGHELKFLDGWWFVSPAQSGPTSEPAQDVDDPQSS